MSTGPFALLLAASLGSAAIAGASAIFLCTRSEGFYNGRHWRVHLGDFGRLWKVQILPMYSWENVGTVPVADGRQTAIALAKAAIDAL